MLNEFILLDPGSILSIVIDNITPNYHPIPIDTWQDSTKVFVHLFRDSPQPIAHNKVINAVQHPVVILNDLIHIIRQRGMAVTMGDHFEKVYHMAVIDAACNQGIFAGEKRLMELEEQQITREEKENAMHLKTMVNFQSMDSEVG